MIQRGSIREALSTWMEAESLVYATHEQRCFLSEQLPKKSKARKMCQSTAKQEIRDEFEINPSLSLCQSRCPPNLVRFLAIFSLIPPHWGRQGNIFPNTWWGTLHYFPLQRVTVEEDADERSSPSYIHMQWLHLTVCWLQEWCFSSYISFLYQLGESALSLQLWLSKASKRVFKRNSPSPAGICLWGMTSAF